MLRTLYRLLPTDSKRALRSLVGWLGSAAILQGITLGLVGVAVAFCLDAGPSSVWWMVALGVAALAYVIVQWIAQMVAFRVGSETARAMHGSLGDHLQELPLGWFSPHRRGQAIDAATAGIPQLMSYPAILLRPAMTALVTPPAAAITLGLLDIRATLAVVAATVVAWFASRSSSRLARVVDERRHGVRAEATARILEFAERQPLIRTDQRADDDAVDHAISGVRSASLRSAGTVLPGLLLFGVTLNALFAMILAGGFAAVTGNDLSVPAYIGIAVVAARLTAVASAGGDLAAGLRLQRGALNRVAEILDARQLPLRADERREPWRDHDALVHAERVTFAYNGNDVLHDVSLTLPRRGLTAVVGPSGAGKTTIARLLVRFWDPGSGRILLDGRDLRTFDQTDLSAYVATVLQDDHLLDTSIGDNIRLGRQDATEQDVRDAVHAAGLGDTIAELPDGLASPVGPGGSLLSGGQRQRVCIARALLKAAPLTLLDEATSALDPENARVVTEAARQLARNGSVLVIAHNIDTITDADQILVIEDGRIVQRGRHLELSRESGRYRELLADR